MAIKNRSEFKVPPLVPQNISTSKFNPKWLRYHFIQSLVEMNRWTRGAEIGLWQGTTTNHLLAHCPKLFMYGVDLWEPQPGNPGPEGYEGWDHDEHERKCRARLKPFEGRYELFKDYSENARNHVKDQSLDFVFIDADHSYEGCAADILYWGPKLKPTGWLLGHDINWPGVQRAVEQFVPDYLIGPNVVWFRPQNPKPGWQTPFGDR